MFVKPGGKLLGLTEALRIETMKMTRTATAASCTEDHSTDMTESNIVPIRQNPNVATVNNWNEFFQSWIFEMHFAPFSGESE